MLIREGCERQASAEHPALEPPYESLGAQALARLALELGTKGGPGGRGACGPVSQAEQDRQRCAPRQAAMLVMLAAPTMHPDGPR
jgi:hypothetical protein